MSSHSNTHQPETHEESDRLQKVQSLREMIANAERTMQSAKAMLLQLEGKKKAGRPRKVETGDGSVIEGTFDGQLMLGTDGKQYPVPANYASKSKLVEGDMLKLTITSDGTFLYKQIGPVERRHLLGIVTQDEKGNYYIVADGTPYRILLASITYFRAEPGDEVAIVVPRDLPSSWAALESIIQKSRHNFDESPLPRVTGDQVYGNWKQGLRDEHTEEIDSELPSRTPSKKDDTNLLDDWVKDMEEIEQEVRKDVKHSSSEEDTSKPGATQPASNADDKSFLDQWLKDMEAIEQEIKKEETSSKEPAKSE